MDLKKYFLNKSNVIRIFLCLILISLPFLCVFVISLCSGYNGSFKILVPVWNDEIGWYNQVDSVIRYGVPLGYNGYNETHSQLGTFGPWGIASLLPYALLGKLFGWSFNSMAIFNMAFLSFSLFGFILLTKPSNKQLVFLITGYLSLYVAIGYSMTSMSESLRYACAIFLTGFIIRTERRTRETGDCFNPKEMFLFVLGCIFTLYCIQIYVILSLAIFPILFFILRKVKLNTPLRLILSVLITLIVAAASYKLVSAVSCPYFKPSTVELIIGSIKTEGLFKGICFALTNFTNNLTNSIFMAMGLGSGENGNLLLWYFIAYIGLLTLLLIWQTLKIFRKKDLVSGDNVFLNLALYFLAGFLSAYCLLYTSSSWTLTRGTNTGLTAAVFLLAFCEAGTPRRFQSAMSLLAVVSVFTYYGIVINERYQTAEYEAEIISEKEKLSEIIIISPELSAWENTVAYYGNADIRTLSIPSGAGINSIYDGRICQKSKYAVVTSEESEEYGQGFEKGGYILIYSDEYFIIYENKNYLK